jgi:hypothetical protein
MAEFHSMQVQEMTHMSLFRNFMKPLLAVLAGNLTYYQLSSHLPPILQHQPFLIDWGLLADFWVCLVWWGCLDLIIRIWTRHGTGG